MVAIKINGAAFVSPVPDSTQIRADRAHLPIRRTEI
jgi:hypothetical protein